MARTILEQRSDIEVFFLDSLHQVKQEIKGNRERYEKAAKDMYHKEMGAAHLGSPGAVLPPIQTFGKAGASTNSLAETFEAAGQLPDDWETLELRDLTWEQREKVLRLMFARMNQSRVPPKPKNPKPTATMGEDELRAALLAGPEVMRPLPISLDQFVLTGDGAGPAALPAPPAAAGAGPAGPAEPGVEKTSFFLTEPVIGGDLAAAQGAATLAVATPAAAQPVAT